MNILDKLPMFQRQGGSAIKPGLDHIQSMCAALGHPERKFPAVHVAGTNGKGSVSSMMASVLTAQGYKTGLFTSPHLKSFTERIRINGQAIAEEDALGFADQHEKLIEATDLSFFEATTAMAFDYFARQQVDIAVIEVGLGGKFDSTNVLNSILTAIAQIGLDHQSILGNTLPEIAREKAGIIKPGVPIVLGKNKSTVWETIFQEAEMQKAPFCYAPEWVEAIKTQGDLYGNFYDLTFREGDSLTGLFCDLPGWYQAENLATAAQALKLLEKSGFACSPEAWRRGLGAVKQFAGLRGRMEVLQDNPRVIADIGHNESGVEVAIMQIVSSEYKQLHIVWGMSADKDHQSMLGLLPREAIYYFVKPDLPRGTDANELKEKAATMGLMGESYASVRAGYEAALERADPVDLVFVGGSAYVVAEVI
ncbi:MAG: bifunctional folylpolyglutamate synthase/dihydrofolate synthase [Bacteroidia bacterium]|nr:bifunctional folylpolyglutamate synthase/dihydrofolate synthase [Bacteroidia bacterium]